MLYNLVPVSAAVPPGGLALSLYPNTSKPGFWVFVLDHPEKGVRHLSISEQLVPRGIPAQGIKLLAEKTDTGWLFTYGYLPDPKKAQINQISVPDSASLKKSVEKLLNVEIQTLLPSLIKLVS